jgi:hypothetical protein
VIVEKLLVRPNRPKIGGIQNALEFEKIAYNAPRRNLFSAILVKKSFSTDTPDNNT